MIGHQIKKQAQQVDSPDRRLISLAKEKYWLAAARDHGRWTDPNDPH